ncbi:hypothetical protein A3844_16155 [Paenibacillus helianthi]|uniref:VTT domain-containing protein n=1 Tax=Paenibacillus helianthi TaxID=1349432 RepID=A0ABX3ELN4_9BACL|nr:DedA family protein [Paenibacillus helianthi]OKP85464.1 hypothetical protein A3844_16155 [Paenibacillus helianthi]
MEMVTEFISQFGYAAIVILLALGIVGLPIPDETLMVFVGYLASVHVLNYVLVILFSFIGSVAGMTISYTIGRKLGYSIIHKCGKWVGLTPKRYRKVKRWFAKYGVWTIFFSYFIPGVRHAAGYISGITTMPFKKYFLLCCIGAAVWTVLFVSIGFFVGQKFSF